MLIIYAHPNHEGHCGEILKNIKQKLDDKKINYKILDLYAMNYDPVLKSNELYTAGKHDISEENREIQKSIAAEDRFIFIYPTWWNNLPAILKGFIDRVFTSNFGYKYVNNIPCGLLHGKALIFTSTGASKLLYNLFLGRRSIKVLAKDSLKFCGLKSRGLVIDRALKLDENQKIKINKTVEKGLKFLL